MRRLRLSTAVALGAFVVAVIIFNAAVSFPQPPKEKKDKGAQGKSAGESPFEVETARLAKLLEKAERPTETERDRLLKELAKVPAPPAVSPSASEFDVWFLKITGGGSVWERDASPRKSMAELFDRIARRLEITNGRISHNQFVAYANEYLREGSSPAWKVRKPIDLAEEADDTLKKLDRDRDGRLSSDEMPENLRTALATWDANRDGFIDRAEFRAYFPNRLQSYYNQTGIARRAAHGSDGHPPVYRAGNLPAGLPAWFQTLDADEDGQVGLYEWRLSGWTTDDFRRLDRNDDGLLEPLEVVKQLQLTDRSGNHPNADLAGLKLDSVALRQIESGTTSEERFGKKGKGWKGK